MKTEFVLRITIERDTTQGDANLSDIVRKAADYIGFQGIEDCRGYNVRDLEGNVVGRMVRGCVEEED